MTPVISGPGMLTHPKRPPHRKGVPNDLPTEKEADIRAQIDLMKEVSHCGTIEVSLDCAGETSAVDHQGLFCSFALQSGVYRYCMP